MDVIGSLEVPNSAVPIVRDGKVVGYLIAPEPDEMLNDQPFDPAGWTDLGFLEN